MISLLKLIVIFFINMQNQYSNKICIQKLKVYQQDLVTSYITWHYFVKILIFSRYFQINYPAVSSTIFSESYKQVLVINVTILVKFQYFVVPG